MNDVLDHISDEVLNGIFVTEVCGWRRGSEIGERPEYWYEFGRPKFIEVPMFTRDLNEVMRRLVQCPEYAELQHGAFHGGFHCCIGRAGTWKASGHSKDNPARAVAIALIRWVRAKGGRS